MFKYHPWNDVITRQNMLIKSLSYCPLDDDRPGVMIHGHVWLQHGAESHGGGERGEFHPPCPENQVAAAPPAPVPAIFLPLSARERSVGLWGEPGQGARVAEELSKE